MSRTTLHLVAAFLVGYFVCVFFPGVGNSIKGAIGL